MIFFFSCLLLGVYTGFCKGASPAAPAPPGNEAKPKNGEKHQCCRFGCLKGAQASTAFVLLEELLRQEGTRGWWRSVREDHTSPSFAPAHTSAGNGRSFKTSQVEEADVCEDEYAGLWPVVVGV